MLDIFPWRPNKVPDHFTLITVYMAHCSADCFVILSLYNSVFVQRLLLKNKGDENEIWHDRKLAARCYHQSTSHRAVAHFTCKPLTTAVSVPSHVKWVTVLFCTHTKTLGLLSGPIQFCTANSLSTQQWAIWWTYLIIIFFCCLCIQYFLILPMLKSYAA